MAESERGAILLISDLHAHYHLVDAQVAHAREVLGRTVYRVIVLGDFGLFGSNLYEFFRRDGRRFTCPVSFIEGNHEDFVAFDRLISDYADVVTHLPRCSVQGFDSRRWLCIGGARYMDAWSTPGGCEIRRDEVAACLAHEAGSIDIVISHDCPTGIGVTSDGELGHLGEPGVPGLAEIAAHLRPRWWFFGHHHRWHQTEANGTTFLGLPQSWQGYVLMDETGGIQRVENVVPLPRRPRWWKWIGLK